MQRKEARSNQAKFHIRGSGYPRVRLIVDRKTDTQQGIGFVENEIRKHPHFAQRYIPDVLGFTLAKNFPKKKRQAFIRGYANYCYAHYGAEIKKGTQRAAADWENVEKKYFLLIDRLFKKHSWPDGWYVGFATIWGSYPRSIKTKTFHFPYWHPDQKYANKVIAHEMLHFMFFDYIEARYGLTEQSRIKKNDLEYVWKVSEAFNNVIEEWKPYKDVFIYPARPHRGTEEIFKKMNVQWKQKQDVDWLLDKWLSRI